MNRKALLITSFILICLISRSQDVGSSPEYIRALTQEWKGERFPDGRPKVSDAVLERLKNVSLEEAWGYLRNKGFMNQYEGDWIIINPDIPMTGRIVTAQYMPLRPDLEKYIKEKGKAENRTRQGGTNSWPIDVLIEGDVDCRRHPYRRQPWKFNLCKVKKRGCFLWVSKRPGRPC
jgi:hypothetical protein